VIRAARARSLVASRRKERLTRPLPTGDAGRRLLPQARRCTLHGVSNESPPHFADRLVQSTRELGHPLCVGLDPHLELIPPLFRRGDMKPAAPLTAVAVQDFLSAVIDRLPGKVAVVKPQIAFFEQLGWQGIRSLEFLVRRARRRGLLVLLDAKRGDIGSTADGYARAYLEPDSPIAVDAITLNPYLGPDSLDPFVARAKDHGRGLFVLVKTSNPGSGELQDRMLADCTVFERVAAWLAKAEEDLRGPATGWSSLGVVVGATYPGQHAAVRAQLPRALFLVPGYGAQGASARDALQGFEPRADGAGLEGGIVSSSRAVLFPESGNSGDALQWERAFDAALARAVGELREAADGSAAARARIAPAGKGESP